MRPEKGGRSKSVRGGNEFHDNSDIECKRLIAWLGVRLLQEMLANSCCQPGCAAMRCDLEKFAQVTVTGNRCTRHDTDER